MSAAKRFAIRHFRWAAEAAELDRIRSHLRALRDRGYTRVIVGCGYPKSGNTWLCRLLAQALGCPALGYLGRNNPKDLAQDGQARESSLAVLKSHHSFRVLARSGVEVVHVARDPRDVAVSAAFYFFREAPERFEQAVAMLVRKSRRARVDFRQASWADHVEPFVGAQGTRYETLLENPAGELSRLTAGLGFEPPPGRIAQACEDQSFGKLRQLESPAAPGFFRAGTAGRYADFLSADQIARIESRSAALMERLGYPLSRSRPAAAASPGSEPRRPA